MKTWCPYGVDTLIKLICEDHFGQTLTLDLAGIVQGKP